MKVLITIQMLYINLVWYHLFALIDQFKKVWYIWNKGICLELLSHGFDHSSADDNWNGVY